MATHELLPPSVDRDLRRATAILKRWGASEVYLFGSYANGTPRLDSDIGLDYDNEVSRTLRSNAELVRVG